MLVGGLWGSAPRSLAIALLLIVKARLDLFGVALVVERE